MSRLLVFALAFAACTPNAGQARGAWKPTGKADSNATCAGSCGGQAGVGCWCDGLCSQYGDCCPDKIEVCGGPRPPSALDGGSSWDAGSSPPWDAGSSPPWDAGSSPPWDGGSWPAWDAGFWPSWDAGPPSSDLAPVGPSIDLLPANAGYAVADADVTQYLQWMEVAIGEVTGTTWPGFTQLTVTGVYSESIPLSDGSFFYHGYTFTAGAPVTLRFDGPIGSFTVHTFGGHYQGFSQVEAVPSPDGLGGYLPGAAPAWNPDTTYEVVPATFSFLP